MATHVKPLGVILIAFYFILSELLFIPLGTLMLFSLVLPDSNTGVASLGFLFMLMGVSYMVSSYGLWTIQSWGSNFAGGLSIVSILLGVAAIFPIFPDSKVAGVENTIIQLTGIAICGVILWYLRRPRIVNLYGTGGSSSI